VSGNYYYSLSILYFLSQLTLSICVWRWSRDLSCGSIWESKWACWCIGIERDKLDDLLYVLISYICNKLYEAFLKYELVIMMSQRNITTTI